MSYLPDERYSASAEHERTSLRSFLGLTLLGTVLPGSGLLLAGRRWAGGLLLGAFVGLVVGATVYFAWHGTDGAVVRAISVAGDPKILLAVVIVGAAFLLAWLGSVWWTAAITWPSRPQTGRRVFASVVAALLTIVLVAPAAAAGRYALIQRDLVASLFKDSPARNGKSPHSGEDDAWAGFPRVNILLVGSDSGPDRTGVRTDSMMLASIDTHTGDTVLFGLPRNLEKAPFPPGTPLAKIWPNGYNCGSECLLNAVWGEGVTHASLYPGDPQPGLTALSQSVTAITGLSPDYAAVVNMASFSALVNAMGGVDITVKQRVPIGGRLDANHQIVPGSIHGWIEPGRQHLDGYHAMWYARGRVTTDDYDRMRRQRCMVGALVKQVNPVTMIQRYPALATVAKDNLYTNIPQADLGAFAQLVMRMKNGKIRSLPFSNKVVDVTDPNYPLIQAKVAEAIAGGGTSSASTPSASSTPSPSSTPTPSRSRSTSGTGSTPSPSATADDHIVDVAEAC